MNNLPQAFVRRMKDMLREEYDAFYKAYTAGISYSGIRINTLKTGCEALTKRFELTESVPWCETGYYCEKEKISGNHPYHRAGLFYFQEPSAMAAAEGLPIQPGDKVLDLCAAPGGKSTRAAELLQGEGLLVANEVIPKRAAVLSENIERMGFSNVVVTNEYPERLAEKYPGFFDKIIVDAPCSGEGMFRKEEQAMPDWSIEHTISCGMRQKNILDSAVKMLSPGGMLLYSTCTFAPEENEQVASYILETYPFLTLVPMPGLSMLSPGCTEWGNGQDMTLCRRIFPHHQKGEGHFIALFAYTGIRTAYPAKKQDKPRQSKKDPLTDMIRVYREFEKKVLYCHLGTEEQFTAFGERLYLKPTGLSVNGIRVLRCGLEMGECKKGRFEPSHGLCLSLKKEDFKQTADFPADSPMLLEYLRGNVIPGTNEGWTAVTVDGFPVGWGKVSGGMLKNHYPKGLRLLK